ncbi:MAG: hypothetical protein ACOYW3_16180 [Bacteroidota bacterium]
MKEILIAIGLGLLSQVVAAQPEHAWVRVKAENGMESKIDTIHFHISDGYVSRTVYSTPNQDGVFLANFDVSNSLDILWGYRRNQALPLIISPNDTLQITIISEKDGVLFGKRARTCANLVEMYAADNRPRVQVYEKEYKSNPNEFVDFMNERLNAHLSFANNFCSSQKCTKTFVTWYIKSVYVSYYRNLADYCNALQAKASDGTVPVTKFLKARDIILKNIDLNDPTLEMSSGYYDLLKSIFNLYVSADEFREAYYVAASSWLLQRNVSSTDKRILERVASGAFADTDLQVVRRLSEKHKREIHSKVWKSMDPFVQRRLDEIKDEDLRRVMTTYYKGIQNFI